MNFKPLRDQILVKTEAPPEQTPAGLHIPKVARGKALFGVIVATGPGKRSLTDGRHQPLVAQPGDRVAFGTYAGVKVEVLGESYLLMQEADILGIIS